MTDIKQREDKIQEKRKKTSWRDFLMEIVSRQRLTFYKNHGLISRYPETERVNRIIKGGQEYETIREDLVKYGRAYDFSKNLFINIDTLGKEVPLPSIMTHGGSENSDYTDGSYRCKNAYLSNIVIYDSEDVLYSYSVKGSTKKVLNSVAIRNTCDTVYFSTGVLNSSNVFYSKLIETSHNIWFSANLLGCSECVCCDSLTNQSYCIQNTQYSKEEYKQKKAEILANKNTYLSMYESLAIKMDVSHSISIKNCENVQHGFFINQLKNGNNCGFVGGTSEVQQNIYDSIGVANSQDLYANSGSGTGDRLYCNVDSGGGSALFYCNMTIFCSYCIGCIGLKNKQFCILNKQYTKEERFELANKIFEQMERDGILGQFFPGSMNPFYFNDTVASLIDDSFTKEEVAKEGYLRRDEEIKVDTPAGAEVITTKELNNFQGFNEKGEREINPEVLKKVIKDEKGNYYGIVPMELEFLQKHGLPLPDIHRLDRIKLGFTCK